ncbi:hypothetical protein ACQKWADRAFT_307684 [Trichoderma austrokoningii]
MNRCHDSIAGTAAVGVAACRRIPNSMLSKILREGSYQRYVVQIRHPEGIMPIRSEPRPQANNTTSWN